MALNWPDSFALKDVIYWWYVGTVYGDKIVADYFLIEFDGFLAVGGVFGNVETFHELNLVSKKSKFSGRPPAVIKKR